MKMTKPSLKVTRFSDKDVIATSGVSPVAGPFLIFSNLGDNTKTNNKLEIMKNGQIVGSIEKKDYNGRGFTPYAAANAAVSLIRKEFGVDDISASINFYYNTGTEDKITLNDIFVYAASEPIAANGQYQYNSGGYFYKTN